MTPPTPTAGPSAPETADTFDIQELREAGADGGDLMGYYCRGHVPRYEFAEACNGLTGADAVYDARFVRPDECHHVWWRTVPISGEDGHARFVAAEPGARGAWKATVWEGIARAQLRGMRDHVSTDRSGHRRGFAEGVAWALRTLDNRHGEAGGYLAAAWQARGETETERHLDRGSVR